MLLGRDIMSRKVIVLKADDTVMAAAEALSKNRVGAAPVMDDMGNMIGIVSEGDLVVQDVKLHFPTFIHFLDSYIFLESVSRFEGMLKKAVAAKVSDLMTRDVIHVGPDDAVSDIATLMVDKHIGRVPVVADGKVVGMITKGDIVRSLGREK